MASNFDFLKKIDKELFSLVQESEKLFRDGYFNQCVIQLRIFIETLSKSILSNADNLTLDDTLNCLKDKIKSEREREFIEDLFFIKKQGNKCAHGEDVEMSQALEAIRHAFEASINYAYSKKKDEKIDKLIFDETLLITQKPKKEVSIVDKYVELAANQTQELLNLKQGEFSAAIEKSEEDFKDKNSIKNPKKYKAQNPSKEKIKQKVKKARKNLRENINKIPKKPIIKQQKLKTQQRKKLIKLVAFLSFVVISLFLLSKMIFFF